MIVYAQVQNDDCSKVDDVPYYNFIWKTLSTWNNDNVNNHQ